MEEKRYPARLGYPTAHPLFLFRTGPMPCPYLDGHSEQRLVALPDMEEAQRHHDDLAAAGFRRSHQYFYRPACPGCDACIAVRVPTRDFVPGRSHRRILSRNRDLSLIERPANATAEQYRLFARYEMARHGDGDMAKMTYEDYAGMVGDSLVDSALLEYRDRDGQLIAVMLQDAMRDGLSAVYSFFTPDEAQRSLGTFMVLDMIRRAAANDLGYVYLGYWIADCRKMAYKTCFRPLEGLGPDGWHIIA